MKVNPPASLLRAFNTVNIYVLQFIPSHVAGIRGDLRSTEQPGGSLLARFYHKSETDADGNENGFSGGIRPFSRI